MSIGIRGFTIGYDFYAPERSVCFHHYAEGKNAKARNKGEAREHLEMYNCCEYRFISRLSSYLLIVPHYWENSNQFSG